MPSSASSRSSGAPAPPARADAELAARLRDLHSLHRGLAHDLRGPLHAIVLQLELLRVELSRLDPAGAPERIERLEREVARLRAGADRLLSVLAPPGSFPDRWDAGELATAVGELLAPQARQRRVEMAPPVPDRALPTTGDWEDALAAWLRVAVDALAALPEGGQLALSVSPAESGTGTLFRAALDAAPPSAASGPETPDLTRCELARARAALEALGGRLTVAHETATRAVLAAWLPAELARRSD